MLNNKKFAENDNEFIGSLFNSGGTCVGYARRLKRSIKLFDVQGNLIAVISKYGVLCKATKQDNGSIWYSYGNVDLLGDYSIQDKARDLDSIATDKSYLGIETVYQFK